MIRRKLLFLLIHLPIITVSKPSQARFYWDGRPTFSTLETWEIIVFGIILLVVAGAFIFTLVKLINFFFAKK